MNLLLYLLYRMDEMISMIFQHGGNLHINEKMKLEYVGGKIDMWDNINPDTNNFIDFVTLVKNCRDTTTKNGFNSTST